MNGEDCTEMQLLLQADLDGELTAAESARMAGHLATCESCRKMQQSLAAMSANIRASAMRYQAPADLRAAVAKQIGVFSRPPAPSVRPRTWFQLMVPAAGYAIAACLALVLLLPHGSGLPDQLVADHIHALQPGHLIDVVSTDQHTVKPWFDGRLDFAPPVRDFREQGFPLAGGRLDYVANRPVAALIYRRGLHVIDVYVWPDSGSLTASGSRDGYNYLQWRQGGMVFWAVSDLNAQEILEFSRLWEGK